MNRSYRIGEVAAMVGMTVEGLRFYERRGLVVPATRAPSGYRRYTAEDARAVRFIKAAQEMGFSLAEIEELLRLRRGGRDTCESVRDRLLAKRRHVRRKIELLQQLAKDLERSINRCEGRLRSGTDDECPVLGDLWSTGD